MSRDNAHLRDFLDSALAIRRYLDGIGREQFEQNAEKQDAVIRRFEIMGEAARRLSPEVQAALPEIPWRFVTGMRNILIHDYDEVNLNIVWDAAQRDLPPLIAALEAYLLPRLPRDDKR